MTRALVTAGFAVAWLAGFVHGVAWAAIEWRMESWSWPHWPGVPR